MKTIERHKILVQIGTHSGTSENDPFNGIVKKSHPSKVILVEPNVMLNDAIWRNYAGVNNVFLENVAITKEKGRGVVSLVYPKNNRNGVSVNGVHYGDHNFSLVPMDDWEDDFEVMKVPSMTFNELCEKYGINHIHYLQIDTEGYDSEIIQSIDFSKIKIDVIQYEDWPFGEDCYKRYGDRAKLYGKSGGERVRRFLESHGYSVLDEGRHDMRAVKN